nr:MAG TPA: tail assembly chaperone protein [Caudoviricetes sp.]
MYPPVMYIWFCVTQKQLIEVNTMKILKYKLATEANHGTPEKPMMETVLSDVSMPYTTETDYQMALSEAWQGEVTVEEVPETADEIRARRDRLLAATDWAVLPDSPLDAQSLEAVKTYRQALRDVPQQEHFPDSITWPQIPELANLP